MQKTARIDFLRSFGVTGAIVEAECSTRAIVEAEREFSRKPNFVIFLTDDHRYNNVGCFGSPDIKTPNVDRKVREGILFFDPETKRPDIATNNS